MRVCTHLFKALIWISIFFSFSMSLVRAPSVAASESSSVVSVGGDYSIDMRPFESHPKLAAQYKKLQDKFSRQPLTLDEHRRRIEIIQKIQKDLPNWNDGYWLLATDTFFMSAELAYRKSYDKARSVIAEGLKSVRTCITKDANQVLCRFFEAALLAKRASIDGIFASLEYGQQLRDLWLEVVKKNRNIVFQSNVTLLGSAHYALGLFYRLVPDFFLIDWLWNIRGDLDTSIHHHRQAVKFDPENPCANLMLAVALLCKADGSKKSNEFKEAQGLLKRAETRPAIDVAQRVCVQDVPIIRSEPNRTCGYTQAKYHEDASEEDLKKQQQSKKLQGS